jgi:hypothetical protein
MQRVCKLSCNEMDVEEVLIKVSGW